MEERYRKIEEYYEEIKQKQRFKFLEKLSSENPKINLGLFVVTCFTTFLTGWLQNGAWQSGIWYSVGIISILSAHEMGHYLMCRKYKIKATLPFFIPFPPFVNPFGTMGAVIKMEAIIPSRKALFDVAAAGPLAGLALTIPAIYFGIQMSDIVDATRSQSAGVIYLGESLLYAQLSNFAVGSLPDSKDVLLHPLAYAGWAGLFVTALNLLPIGQLDGGHIIYALVGKKHKAIALIGLLLFGALVIKYPGWIVLFLLLILFGYKHPPTLDERPIDLKRKIIGLITIVIFFLSFTPEPFVFLN
jgi:membrane-associated protease RseP (regulator of RpoE activity)